jgi:hypothetical protein
MKNQKYFLQLYLWLNFYMCFLENENYYSLVYCLSWFQINIFPMNKHEDLDIAILSALLNCKYRFLQSGSSRLCYIIVIQWNLINLDTINPNASTSGRYFWGTNYTKIYHLCFNYPDTSFIRIIFLGTKMSGLTRLHCTLYTIAHLLSFRLANSSKVSFNIVLLCLYVKFIHYQFWCTRCAFRQFMSLQ